MAHVAYPLAPLRYQPVAPVKPKKRVGFASQVETKTFCIDSSQDSELLSQDMENVCFVQVSFYEVYFISVYPDKTD